RCALAAHDGARLLRPAGRRPGAAGAPGGALRSQLAGDRSKGGGMTPHDDAPAVGRENERLERMLEAARAMKEWPLLGIRERRMAAGMSLRELAAAVGISSVEMGEYERGVRLPTMSTAAAISRAISAASPSGT